MSLPYPRRRTRKRRIDSLEIDTDFSRVASGALPYPWYDISTISGLETYEDEIAVRSGRLTQVEFQGDPYPGGPSGHRSGAAISTELSASDGVAITTWHAPPTVANRQVGGPMASFKHDDIDHFVGTWLVGLFPWAEIGWGGRQPLDFTYADTTWLDLDMFGDLDEVASTLFMHSSGVCWLMVDDVRIAGPVNIPAALMSSTEQGAQLDIGQISQIVSSMRRVRITPYNGPAAAAYPPPTLTVGTIIKGTGTTKAVAIPNGIQRGERIILHIASNGSVTTPDGWTAETTVTSTGIILRAYYLDVTGNEPWYGRTNQTLTVTHANGAAAGVIVRMEKTNQGRPYLAAANADTSNNTSSALGQISLFGPHRATLGVVAVPIDTTITLPAGWTVVQTSAGGAGITLAVCTVADWSSPGGGLSMIEGSATAGNPLIVDTTAITLGSATTAATVIYAVYPDPLSAPI